MLNFIYCNSWCGAAKVSAPSTIFFLTDCWHIFCVNCFRGHTKRNKGCPVCKHQPLKGIALSEKCPPAYQAYFFKPLDAVKKTIQREKKHHVFQKTQIKGYRRFILYKVFVAKREEQAKDENMKRAKEAEQSIVAMEKERDAHLRCVKSLETEGGGKVKMESSVGNKQDIESNRLGERNGATGQLGHHARQKEQNLTGIAHANNRISGVNRQKGIINSSNVQRQPAGMPRTQNAVPMRNAGAGGSRPPAANQRQNIVNNNVANPGTNANIGSINPGNQTAPGPLNPRAHHQPAIPRVGYVAGRNPSCSLQKTTTGSNIQPSTRDPASRNFSHPPVNNNQQRPMPAGCNRKGDVKISNAEMLDPQTIAARGNGPAGRASNAGMMPPPANIQRQSVPARANQPASRNPNNRVMQSAVKIQRQALASNGVPLNGGVPQGGMMPPSTGIQRQSVPARANQPASRNPNNGVMQSAAKRQALASNGVPLDGRRAPEGGMLPPSAGIQRQSVPARGNQPASRNPNNGAMQSAAEIQRHALASNGVPLNGGVPQGGIQIQSSTTRQRGAVCNNTAGGRVQPAMNIQHQRLAGRPNPQPARNPSAVVQPQRQRSLAKGSETSGDLSNHTSKSVLSGVPQLQGNDQQRNAMFNASRNPQPCGLQTGASNQQQHYAQNRAQPVGGNNQNLPRRTIQQNPMATIGSNQFSGMRQPQINRQTMGGPGQRSSAGTNVQSIGSGRSSAINPTSTAMLPPAPMPKSYFRQVDPGTGIGTSAMKAMTRPNGGPNMGQPVTRTVNIDIGFSNDSFNALQLHAQRATAQNEQRGAYSPPPSSSRATTGWD